MDDLRARRAEVGGWPGWCFLPAAAAHEATLALGWRLNAIEEATLSALFAWRATQGIYWFDETIFDELWSTPVTGDIPVEALEGLPEWCCYLAFPEPRQIGGVEVVGFLAQLQYDLDNHERQLHLALDFGTQLVTTSLSLVGTLEACFAASLARMQETIEREGGRAVGFATTAKARAHVKRSQNYSGELLAPLISLALYLASTSREIRCGMLTEPVRPQVKQTRQYGPRLFPPSAPRVWEVGFRIGDTIRAGIAAIERSQRTGVGSLVRTHSVPRPHLRKAHYHHYWTGPLKGDRQLIVKWLHPILVAAGNNQGLGIVPTVHRVTAALPATAEGRR